MASSIYKITIVNNSGTNSKRYGVFSENPVVKGSGFVNAVQIVWNTVGPVQAQQQQSFEYSSAFYAFVGRSGKQSRTLESGVTNVALEHQYKVALGNDYELGSDLKVGTDFVISGNDKTVGIPVSSFTIGVMATIKMPNFQVLGVARDLVRNHKVARVLPVAGIELRRASRVTFRPSHKVIIALSDLYIGDTNVDKFDPDAMAVVEFEGDMREATVTETIDGSFEVEYF